MKNAPDSAMANVSPLDDHEREALTGNRLGPYCSYQPVSRTQVWQWCSAMGERNPLYLDDGYRARNGLDQRVVAPPAMMQMWTMRDINMQFAPGSTDKAPYAVFDALSARGFAANVAVSYDIEFHHLLREGDRAHHYTTIAAVSELKSTALGNGYFVTECAEFFDQDDRLFARALITYLQYQPAVREAGPSDNTAVSAETGNTTNLNASAQTRATPTAVGALTQLQPGDVNAGDTLRELVLPITHKLIVGGAIATQDYIDVHHNAPAARAAAMPDIFMNILTTCGLCARFLSDWAGPASRLERLSFKLMAPNTPGDTLVLRGQVTGVEHNNDSALCELGFAGENNLGLHVTGAATIRMHQTDSNP